VREAFYIDPTVIFLNNGSFGATPRCVLEASWEWQRELEKQPVNLLVRRAEQLLVDSKQPLATLLGCLATELAWIQNVTFGVNQVAHSLDLGPGDKVLLNNHEYGAVSRTFRYLSLQKGFELCEAALPQDLSNPQQVIDTLVAATDSSTKVWVVSHVTSASALLFPIQEIMQAARRFPGLKVLVDGAHAAGQVPIDLDQLKPDFYVGTLHKWLFCPKGTSFLYVAPQHQASIKPLVIGWNYEPHYATKESQWIYTVQMLGTRDISNFLAVPAALEFSARNPRNLCVNAISSFRKRLGTNFPEAGYSCPLQMVSLKLPSSCNEQELHQWLWSRHKIEVPVHRIGPQAYLRPSFQIYNRQEELESLSQALCTYFGLDLM
jgi:isopenicillin-N epimerase